MRLDHLQLNRDRLGNLLRFQAELLLPLNHAPQLRGEPHRITQKNKGHLQVIHHHKVQKATRHQSVLPADLNEDLPNHLVDSVVKSRRLIAVLCVPTHHE